LIPGKGRDFYNLHYIRTDSGDHSASYPTSIRGSTPGVKRLEREVGESPPFRGELLKIRETVPPYSHTLHCVMFTQVHLILTSRWPYGLLRWKRQYRHVAQDPKILCNNRTSKYMQLVLRSSLYKKNVN
jgi:hypothetical protein